MRTKCVLQKVMPALLSLASILASGVGAGAASTQALVEGNTAFACDLYGQFKNSPGNLFFSPYSISTALAMTYAGAKGETEKQMAHTLHFSGEQPRLHAGFGELQKQLTEIGKLKGIELNIANALWAQQGRQFLPPFLNIATGDYQAIVKQVDFQTASEPARNEINGWVAQKTKDKIQNILPPGSLDDLTRLVLANAIYFKGAWSAPYEKGQTSTQPFYLLTSGNVKAPLMHHYDEVKYVEEGDFQAVELPYGKGEVSIVILLPGEPQGCGKLEDRLTPAFLSGALRRMKKEKVEIFLPRFKLESNFALKPVLARMGMSDALSDKADFSGMDGTKRLFISGVFHKAWAEVNEEGTEAAAATVVVAAQRAIKKVPPPPPVFRADHAFIFLIRDTRSGSILFLGRLANPVA
jgi:serine protease inhibitor